MTLEEIKDYWEKRGAFVGWERNMANPGYNYEKGYYLPIGKTRCVYLGKELPRPITQTLMQIWKDVETQNLFLDFIGATE